MLHRSGLRQVEAPARMIPRQHGDSSITPLRSVYYMIKVILAILINLLRRPHLDSQRSGEGGASQKQRIKRRNLL